jgi:hypothetical protein
MYHLNPKTLAYFKKRPMLTPMDASKVLLSHLIPVRLNPYMDAHTEVNVQENALTFYMLNHAFAALCQKYDDHQIMPADAVRLAESYFQQMNPQCVRLLNYVLLIITREARHLQPTTDFQAKLTKEFGKAFVKFRDSIPSSSTGAVAFLRTHPPAIPVGVYVSAITKVFNEGSFSGGFGGKPWGNIAETLRKLVYGETSYETFVDTAWTLAHNNGPMFNKGMLYAQYNGDLYKILDVQRSGQIPQLVNQCKKKEAAVSGMTSTLAKLHDLMLSVVPEVSDGYVDWVEVEKNGLKKWSGEKATQISKYGFPPSMAAEIAAEKSKFWVTPTEFVKVKERKLA